MVPLGRLALIVSALFLGDQPSPNHYLVQGRVWDAQYHAPVPHAVVRAPSLGIDTAADSLGRFAIAVDAPPGCYLIRFQWLGYGATVRSVALESNGVVSLGDIPLYSAPALEYTTRFLQQCQLPDSVHIDHFSAWGIDTVPVP